MGRRPRVLVDDRQSYAQVRGAGETGSSETRLEQHGGGAFTAWYGRERKIVGVLAHEADEDYERGRSLIAEGAPWR